MNNKTDVMHNQKIAIGVSACLLGAKVRFDGGHKHNRYIEGLLGEHFSFVSYCPEVAIGMTIPRDPIRLVNTDGEIRVVASRDPDVDYSKQLTRYGNEVAGAIQHLRGFIFKKDSPSCGIERVKVYTENGYPKRNGTGFFANEIMKQNPLLPVEEEGRLNDHVLRENFVNRVYVYDRWMELVKSGVSKSRLIDFHTRHKYLLLAHNQQVYRELGRKLSSLERVDVDEFAQEYILAVMTTLKQKANRKTHVNVLQHLLGFLRSCLDGDDRAEILNAIKAYGKGEYPLIVPITLLRHHFRRNPHPFVSQQIYLAPHPDELMLRNNI